ncbi:MAG: 16S rRNA (guanine(527)-N(7))-methyltransferase RsmG [Firmicutes bacterium]|nr:16S rRNA (guanine(527)-N(7))-methyltransferase RsmG [Bacillota bacterium]
MTNQWLLTEAAALGIQVSPEALEQLEQYCLLLQQWNQRINLTTITDTAEVYELHFLDSLSVHLAIDLASRRRVIDVGTGAGLPGVVLAIVFPHLKVTLLESIAKKARFLQEAVDVLELGARVQVVCERAEALGQVPEHREEYDLVVARAVAQLTVLSEYCLPFVQLGGSFVALKGPQGEKEVAAATRSLSILGGSEAQVVPWVLPSGAERTLIRVDKQAPTPQRYPRRVGIPGKRPLT